MHSHYFKVNSIFSLSSAITSPGSNKCLRSCGMWFWMCQVKLYNVAYTQYSHFTHYYSHYSYTPIHTHTHILTYSCICSFTFSFSLFSFSLFFIVNTLFYIIHCATLNWAYMSHFTIKWKIYMQATCCGSKSNYLRPNFSSKSFAPWILGLVEYLSE